MSEQDDPIPSSLDGICADITLQNAKHILLVLYRPPNLPIPWFDKYDMLLHNIEAENKELVVSGDLNCDLLKNPIEKHTKHLVFSCETHQFAQVIDKPPIVTPTSRSIIYVVIASNAEHIAEYDVISLGISDHHLTYCVISARPKHSVHKHRTIETRNIKHFGEAFQQWKSLFMDVFDMYCLIVSRHVRKTFISWIDAETGKNKFTQRPNKRWSNRNQQEENGQHVQ